MLDVCRVLSIVNNYFIGNLLNYWLDLIKLGSNFLYGNSLIIVQMVSFHSLTKSGCPLVTWPFFFKVREKSMHSVKWNVKLKNV